MESFDESYPNYRANNILDVILAYARLDFNQKTIISEKEDVFDAIGSGVNMLGEELENSKISLKEKEQLLKEVHHRVKNNLQIISSLLNLQSEFVDDEKFLALIRESKNRITSMSLIHEMLYSSKNLSQINFKEYIETLYHSIYSTFITKDFKIDIKLKVDPEIHFEIDTMIPIGLILNEIITNSLKYAFPNKKGRISFKAEKQAKNLILTISDNGIGIPPNFDYHKSKSLGLQLIYLLADQIDAQISLDLEQGTKFILQFALSTK